ncbi:unnamed protein product [Protopolystoma xenopodis]|uniref:Uncharacterized protein n=1 Tax=Protopolystoma xenopodis TaxID=117903 RepID=A0A3S5BQU3_9PLAT|nr:unnamed protein product [Protopolystoma xenopodis]
MNQCGAVPLLADTCQIKIVRQHCLSIGGIRISQFPNKKIFYDWAKSGIIFLLPLECGAKFRDEMCKIRSLNSYVATFTKDLF